MDLVIDTSTVPPTTTLEDPTEFGSFKVTLRSSDHVYVPVEDLIQAAGAHADDPQWRAGLEAMLAYAQEHGWIKDGAIRAHVETS
ncbi:MAG: hypothetical protein NTV40_01230 [Solirubrobacterales bacterium]|nr:hypothetical protein [Solirubrobacterales bacterium]